jgi:hypothetical protein
MMILMKEEDHQIIVQDLALENLIHLLGVILNEQNIHKLLKKNYIIFIKF